MKRVHITTGLIWKFYLALLLTASTAAFAKQEGSLDSGLVNPGYEEKPDWFKVSFLDLYDDIAEAATNNRRVMLFFYQDGCPYCKKLLEDNFGQRAIAEKTQKYFDVIAVNIWGDRELTLGDKTMTEKQFAELLKVQYTPTLTLFNEKNQIVYRANGYYPPDKFVSMIDFIGQKKETQQTYQEYLEQHPIKQKSSGQLHTDISTVKSSNLQSAVTPDKHLLVMFEQARCAACDELHNDILKRKESIEQLERFDVKVLDMWSNDAVTAPDGIERTIRNWVKDLNVSYAPTLVFFDSEGKEIFRIDAYLKSFHTQSVMDYVASDAYKTEANFQRYIDGRAAKLRAQGIVVDLMK